MTSTQQLITAGAVARSLNIIGDRWSLLILREVFLGYYRFETIQKHTGTPRGTLTRRLKSLVFNGVLYRNPYQRAPVRFEYRLTDKGLDLYPWALAVWLWEQKWGREDNSLNLPPKLLHKACNNIVTPLYKCGECLYELHYRDIRYAAGPAADKAEPALALGTQRHSKQKADNGLSTGTSSIHISDLIGDRRTALVVSGAFWGLRRFGDFERELKIATNILADRLKVLVKHEIFVRKAYQDNPPRYEYRALEKANDLYPVILSLHQWGSTWLEERGAVLTLIHKCGKEAFTVECRCNHCERKLNPADVSFTFEEDEEAHV